MACFMAEEALVVFSTFADAQAARGIAHTLVAERLAACANLIPQIESIYRWKEEVEAGAEVLVIFKTTPGRYPLFEERLRALHPYEVPEIMAIQVRDGLPDYLNWIVESCNSCNETPGGTASHST
jgi:periplasmic divalent cation tolerance protein